MSVPKWQKVRELFETVCDLAPTEREELLSRACDGDADLRVEVESILACNDRSSSLLETRVDEALDGLLDDGKGFSMIGRRVGKYELVELIACGGMGAVYRAVDFNKPDKKVAIKLIKGPLVTEVALHRFRTEHRSLAKFDHPNIATLIDGGVADGGIPYLVMEYVDGQPIDQYCDEHRYSIANRLHLFRIVCSAVQYAHNHLIVHRDLKPNNILVTSDDTPKLLDFGIAKVLSVEDAPAPKDAFATLTGQRVMTPDYASPEQIRGESITTSSDVYSLGVVLYELLTGHRPHRMKSQVRHEMERTICEEEPERPSTAIQRIVEVLASDGDSTITLTPQKVSEKRNIQPDQLRRRLTGDLDAIVMMALRKEPDRRYASVEQLSQDILRYINGLPVVAQQGSVRYRAGKYLRRNLTAVIFSSAIALSLFAGFIATVWQSRVAMEAKQIAQTQAQRTEQINGFLQDMLASVDPHGTPGEDVTVRKILDEAAVKIDAGALGEQPEVEAEVRTTIGKAYFELGLYEAAELHLAVALELRESVLEESHPMVAASLNGLAVVKKARGEYDEAEPLYRRALALRRVQPAEEDIAVAQTLNDLGVLLKKKGRFAEAESLYRESLGLRRRVHGDQHEDVATTLNNLAAVLKNQGEYEEAESMYRQALDAFREALGEEHYRVAVCLNNLALLLRESGNFQEAEGLLREALAIRRKVFGDKHVAVATGLHNLGLILASVGEVVEAEQVYREALGIRRELLGDDHPYLAHTACNLADLLIGEGGLDEAEQLGIEALAIRRGKLPSDHPSIASSLLLLGRVFLAQQNPIEAEPMLRESLAIFENKMPQGHRRNIEARNALGNCLVALQRFPEAEEMLLGNLALVDSDRSCDDRLREGTLHRIVEFYQAWGKPDQVAEYTRMIEEGQMIQGEDQ